MKFSKLIILIVAAVPGIFPVKAQQIPAAAVWDYDSAKRMMSEGYWKLWSPQVQSKIDKDIDQYRKSNAELRFADVAPGTEVRIEQIAHDFVFGANIFNYDQLGTTERNRRYKELFGTLFNSATVPFYWKKFEMEPNRPRFKQEYWDTEKFWNGLENPKAEPHWRRPAPDPIVEFGKSRGIRLHGHTIAWGNPKWQHPEWLFDQYCPKEEKEKLSKYSKEEFSRLTGKQISELAPKYALALGKVFDKRVEELAAYYGDKLPSWDVVNESAVDFHGDVSTGDKITNSKYGNLLPGDYTNRTFKKANEVFPKTVLLNINDYANNQNYTDQVKSLRADGRRIDIMGSQMHLFNPQLCLDVAAGKEIETPRIVWDKMKIMSQAKLPIHLSEITITAPGDDERGRNIQAVIAYNLYRLWFSVENMMGITWWNIVDDCGAPGEPTTSGLFSRNMEPKPSFFALQKLINQEWVTSLTAKTDKNNEVNFRGFKGKYRVTWKDKSGEYREEVFSLNKNGDGLK
jgi:GH35 family endo-1,4-beta-xylanase